ncbi:putative protein phosphatase 2C 28 [Sesamum angolense]|uniref:PPM-type phosphatase domain-containing protein n=1 Tax=Sesamum angolense TaxID=2727404 RepID=A0AAE2BIA6_9LAMI|nr:putative protein phosphatase 2C 28 [Sesamum angolense]
MEGSNFVPVKIVASFPVFIHLNSHSLPARAVFHLQRGRSISTSDAEIIKIKPNHGSLLLQRSETPDDVLSAFLKEEGISKDDDPKNDDDTNEDDLQKGEGSETNEDDVHQGKGHEHPRDEDGRRTEHGKKKQLRRHVSHGYHLVEGKMKHGMEDYLVAKRKEIDGHELGLYAIFDGHSGRDVAEYLQDHLFDNILNEVPLPRFDFHVYGSALNKIFSQLIMFYHLIHEQPDFWSNPKSAVKRAYEATDNEILENVVGSRGGSTAVTAIIINTEKLVVANVGDSRAVICKNERVKFGLRFMCTGNVPRVDGQLAMTRAFGDERLKDHITAEPDIVIERIEEDTEFIILASDGLWKVMSNQEAVDCIQELRDGQEAAEELIKEALLRESKDDISCVSCDVRLMTMTSVIMLDVSLSLIPILLRSE